MVEKRKQLLQNQHSQKSQERVIVEEKIKEVFSECETLLQYLRDIFQRYQQKNKRKIPEKEIKNRSKNIDLLRKNLNILQDEFRD